MTILLVLLALSVGISLGWMARGTLDDASAQIRRDYQFAQRHPATLSRFAPRTEAEAWTIYEQDEARSQAGEFG